MSVCKAVSEVVAIGSPPRGTHRVSIIIDDPCRRGRNLGHCAVAETLITIAATATLVRRWP